MTAEKQVRPARLAWSTVALPALRDAAAALKSAPFTLGMLGLFLVTAAVTGSFAAGPSSTTIIRAATR